MVKRFIIVVCITLCLASCNKNEQYQAKYDVKNEGINDFIFSEVSDESEYEIADIRNETVEVKDFDNKEYQGEKIKAPFRTYHQEFIDNDKKYYVVKITLYNDYPNDKYLDNYEVVKNGILTDDINYIEFDNKTLLIVDDKFSTVSVRYNGDAIDYHFDEKFFALWLNTGYNIKFTENSVD
ncbi:MAG: hypothetical protein Q4C64_03495 [Erysipelotrichia bacterium]|nr:hypothetical protein [Erysipelotrichia bacterium]